MCPREGGDPAWAPAFAGELGSARRHFVEPRPAVRSGTRRHPFPPQPVIPAKAGISPIGSQHSPTGIPQLPLGRRVARGRCRVGVPKTDTDTDTDTGSDTDTYSTNNYQRGGYRQDNPVTASPGTAAHRFGPSRGLSYTPPICQRRIMIEAFLPHRGAERRRPDLSADRATPAAAPATQNTRTSERNDAASQPPRRPRATPQKMLHQRLHRLHIALPA